MNTLHTSDFITNVTLLPTSTFYRIMRCFHRASQRVWYADMGRVRLRTPGPVHLGLAYVLLFVTNPFPELVVISPDYALRTSLGTFSILRFTPHTGVYDVTTKM